MVKGWPPSTRENEMKIQYKEKKHEIEREVQKIPKNQADDNKIFKYICSFSYIRKT